MPKQDEAQIAVLDTPKGQNMKRYYLSEIFLDPGPPEAWRHRFQAETVDIEYKGGEIAVDPETGIPTQKQLLIIVGSIDHTPFQEIAGLVPLPDVSAGVKLAAIGSGEKLPAQARIKDELGHTDAEIAEVWSGADTLRDVLNHYGRLNNPDFDSNNFDLTDL